MSKAQASRMFADYLKQFQLAKGGGKDHTHTRIPDKTLGVYGGTYRIPHEEHNNFMKRYYEHVIVKRNQEYLTEKHYMENGPILIDIDERYDTSIETRQHTEDDIATFVSTYMDLLKDVVVIDDQTQITVFVQERERVTLDDNVTKDGIHIIICLSLHKAGQMILRDLMMKEIREGRLWSELKSKQTNTVEDLFDESVAKGHANWQMYGSSKPGKRPYIVTRILQFVYKQAEDDWDIIEEETINFNWEKNFHMLSARNQNHPKFDISEQYKEKYEVECLRLIARKAPTIQTANRQLGAMGTTIQHADFSQINSAEVLDAFIERFFDVDDPRNYVYKETHEYTMLLTSDYYGPQSYTNWIRVGWALFNTQKRIMFLTWLKFTSQDGCRNTLRHPGTDKFDWSNVPELWSIWNSWYADERTENGLTERSIRYWAQKCNPEGYEKVRRQTLDYFIEITLTEGPAVATEFDLANVLFYLFKDRFVCVGLRNKCWYEFLDHRWVEIDSANTLRLAISKDMHDVYTNKTREAINSMNALEHSDERWVKLQRRSHKLAEICIMLKTTAKKDNIMKEAAHLFYDQRFFKSLDSNTHLLCFSNGVFDFNEKIFRKGLPEDYISKTTGINYIPLDHAKKTKEYEELNIFLKQLFPEPSGQLYKYQMDFMASLCIGGNENHQMCFWLGTGANGKTALVTLLEKAFGEYKGTVPVTLVTRERLNIGTASPEVAALAGVRLAVMQETSKTDKINEGPMKDLTGGDPITARALYKEPITFRPQFKLVLCTNNLPEIESQDDGTWRRVKVVDFESKFHRRPYEDENHFPKDRYPYQYPIETKLPKKFDKWAPILMSMLIDRVVQTQGEVIDCERVVASSDKYREGQDYLLEFIKDNIEPCEGSRIQKTALLPKFRFWFKANHGRGAPKSQELWDFMEKRYGQYKKGWNNIRFIEPTGENDELQQI